MWSETRFWTPEKKLVMWTFWSAGLYRYTFMPPKLSLVTCPQRPQVTH